MDQPDRQIRPEGPTVSAVVVTRHRIDMLRKTLNAIQASTYPVTEIVVSDDSTDDSTRQMLAVEYPSVLWVEGPHRGLAPNRNNGVRATHGDYILVTDDDVMVDPNFIGAAIRDANGSTKLMFFTDTNEFGNVVKPNALDFLGFATVPYGPGAPYVTANQHCFLIAAEVAKTVTYDEGIFTYGYEEMDYAYRVVAAGYAIHYIPGCVNDHLDAKAGAPGRPEKDASRLYVTFKRHYYVDGNKLKGLAFLGLAIPHHLLALAKSDGTRGLAQAWKNIGYARRMMKQLRKEKR